MLAAGTAGTQTDYWLNEVRIVNAADLANTNFACYMDDDFQPVVLKPNYDTATKTLVISSSTNLPFDTFKVIYYGNTLKDVNLCNPTTY